MARFRRFTALTLLVAGEAVAVAAVERLGHRAPFDLPLDRLEPWLRADPLDALTAALRIVALAAASWLLVITLVYLVARRAGIPAVVRACERAAPRLVRHAVDRALAASIVVGAFTVPLHAARDPGPGVVVEVRTGREPGAGSVASLPSDTATSPRARQVPTAPRDTRVVVATPVVPPLVAPPPPVVTASTVVAQPGDSLWEIAARSLAHATRRDRADVGDEEVARYWLLVCDANRTSLQSGDVNLLYPGEIVSLPPLP